MEYANSLDVCPITRHGEHKPQQKLISARDVMKTGSVIYLPVTAYSSKVNKRYDPIPRGTLYPNADEIKYIRRLVLYKDPAILLLNKPPQLPVQCRAAWMSTIVWMHWQLQHYHMIIKRAPDWCIDLTEKVVAF